MAEPGRVSSSTEEAAMSGDRHSTGEGDATRCIVCKTWFTPETPEQVRCRAHNSAWRRVFSFWDLYDPEAPDGSLPEVESDPASGGAE